MTKTNMDLSELLSKHDHGDFLRCIADTALPGDRHRHRRWRFRHPQVP
jgi:hypothetical protein